MMRKTKTNREVEKEEKIGKKRYRLRKQQEEDAEKELEKMLREKDYRTPEIQDKLC